MARTHGHNITSARACRSRGPPALHTTAQNPAKTEQPETPGPRRVSTIHQSAAFEALDAVISTLCPMPAHLGLSVNARLAAHGKRERMPGQSQGVQDWVRNMPTLRTSRYYISYLSLGSASEMRLFRAPDFQGRLRVHRAWGQTVQSGTWGMPSEPMFRGRFVEINRQLGLRPTRRTGTNNQDWYGWQREVI